MDTSPKPFVCGSEVPVFLSSHYTREHFVGHLMTEGKLDAQQALRRLSADPAPIPGGYDGLGNYYFSEVPDGLQD